MVPTRTHHLGDHPVTVRALTAREIHAWLVEIEAKEAGELPSNPAYDLFFDDCGLDDLARMCDCSADELAEYSHLDLDPILRAARELNAPFFRTRAVLVQARIAVRAQALAAARERLPVASAH